MQNTAKALPRVLMAVDWCNSVEVSEMHQLLKKWAPLSPLDAMELLSPGFPDTLVRPTPVHCSICVTSHADLCLCCMHGVVASHVRAYAVQRLELLTDAQLQTYLLQLCQVLKFEPFLDSALARFLLRRAVRAPTTVGHVLFWLLKAEMHVREVRQRYGVLLEHYLRVCPPEHREALGHQMFVMTKLESIAMAVRALRCARPWWWCVPV